MSDAVLTRAWDAYRAGRIAWNDVQDIQAALMPRCSCGRAGLGIAGGRLLCEECYAAQVGKPLPGVETHTKGVRR